MENASGSFFCTNFPSFRPYYILLLFITTSTTMAQQSSTTSPSLASATNPAPVIAIRAGASLHWFAAITADGGGDIGFGNTSAAFFPRGTFDLAAIMKQVRATEEIDGDVSEKDFLTLKVYNSPTKSELLTIKNPQTIADIFEQFRLAYQRGKGSPSRNLPALWEAHPPTKLSKSWNDPSPTTAPSAK
jgi:hypothetical protein